jgi:hypothetical protein
MKLLCLFCFIALLSASGCEPSPQTPRTPRQDYAGVIQDSQDRRAKAEREWRRMLEAYNAPPAQPDFYQITYTPRSLSSAAGSIQIAESGLDKVALRRAAKQFIERWRELIGADSEAMSLASESQSTDTVRLTYRQANYPFQIAGDFGRMVLIIGRDGKLMQMDDRFIPLVEIPSRPEIEREAAARRLVGRTFTYRDFAGQEQRAQIGGLDEVNVRGLVVLPLEKEGRIEVRLAWEIVAGKSLAWTVYLDAITGEELRAMQNFET